MKRTRITEIVIEMDEVTITRVGRPAAPTLCQRCGEELAMANSCGETEEDVSLMREPTGKGSDSLKVNAFPADLT